MKRIFFLFLMMVSSQLISVDISWGAPQTLSTAGVNASTPNIVEDLSGNATAAWIENGNVLSSSYPAGGSWGTATTLTTVSASSLQLGVDGSGNVTATWVEGGVVNSAYLPSGGSWGTKTALSGSGASSPRFSVNTSGNIAAVWVRNGFIESAVKPSGGIWSLVSMLSTTGVEDGPDVAMGDNGKTIAIWHTVLAGADTIFTSTSIALGIWSPGANVLPVAPALHHNYPRIAVDANGNAVAIWFRYVLSGSTYSSVAVMGSSLASGATAWAIPTVITNPGLRNPSTLQTHIRFDGNGNAIALWVTSYDGETFNVESAALPVGGSWTPGGEVVQQNLYSYQGDVAVIPFGDSVVAYMYYDGTNLVIQAAETDIGGFRQNLYSIPINVSTGTDNGYPSVAASLTGTTLNAAALWLGFDGSNTRVTASIGSKTIVLPPTSLAVVQSNTGFGVFTDYFNTISWTGSSSPNVTGYAIYRNGFYFTSVDSLTFQFVDHNAVQNGSVTYGVSAIDNTNAQSTISTKSFP